MQTISAEGAIHCRIGSRFRDRTPKGNFTSGALPQASVRRAPLALTNPTPPATNYSLTSSSC